MDTTPTTPRLLTEREAAAYIAMSVRYLRQGRCYPSKGTAHPPHVKIGSRAVRYDVRDLDAWIDANKRAMPGRATTAAV